jgi:HD superfamily phosphohydrolase
MELDNILQLRESQS